MSSIDCPECRTTNPPGNKFCESCGVHLGAARKPAAGDSDDVEPPRRSSARRSRTRAKTTRGEKVAIQQDLVKARRTVKTVRVLFAILAIPAAFIAFGSLIATSLISELPLVITVLSWASFLFLVAGALFAHLHPLGWTLALASLISLSGIITLISGSIPWIDAFVAAALWASVPRMLKIQRLMREHPDLVDTSKLRRREHREGVEGSEARARAERRAHRESKGKIKSYAITAGVMLVALIVIVVVVRMSKSNGGSTVPIGVGGAPPVILSAAEVERIQGLLPARIADFERAWAATDLETIKGMFTEDKQITFWPKMEGLLQRREWVDDLPDMDEARYYSRGQTERDVFFDLSPKGELKTRWSYEGDSWQIIRLVFSKTR